MDDDFAAILFVVLTTVIVAVVLVKLALQFVFRWIWRKEASASICWSIAFTVVFGPPLVWCMLGIIMAKRAQHEPSCMSQLKQIAVAMAMYCKDYDDTSVRCDSSGGWALALYPYLLNQEMLICPSAKELNRCGYEMNLHLSGIRGKDVGNPADVAHLWDSTLNRVDAVGLCKDGCTRHNDGLNVAFYDGHVKWMRPTDPLFSCSVAQPSPNPGSVPTNKTRPGR